MIKGARFSPDMVYRYDLWRIWDERKSVVSFVCLNPSTADENVDDPTIRRCMGFAGRWGYGGVHVLNAFAYRNTYPETLRGIKEPVGPENDEFLRTLHGVVLVAWGEHGRFLKRGNTILKLIQVDCFCLGKNKSGQPRHPLYVPYSQQREAYFLDRKPPVV